MRADDAAEVALWGGRARRQSGRRDRPCRRVVIEMRVVGGGAGATGANGSAENRTAIDPQWERPEPGKVCSRWKCCPPGSTLTSAHPLTRPVAGEDSAGSESDLQPTLLCRRPDNTAGPGIASLDILATLDSRSAWFHVRVSPNASWSTKDVTVRLMPRVGLVKGCLGAPGMNGRPPAHPLAPRPGQSPTSPPPQSPRGWWRFAWHPVGPR